MPSLETMQLLSVAADACDSRKAEDIQILALDPAESALTDYFLICSGTNERQNVAISDEIEHRLKQEFNTYPNSVEGRRQGEWVLMDYVDFVVHIFMPEKREYYGLERLRKSAKTLSGEDLSKDIKDAIQAARARPADTDQAQPAIAEEPGNKAPAKKRAVKKAAKSSPATKPSKAAAKKSAVRKTTAKKRAKTTGF